MIDLKSDQHIGQLDPRDQVYIISTSGANLTHKVLPHQTQIIADANSTNTIAITLPSVQDARGRVYSIRCPDVGGGVTVADEDDSVEWSDQTFDADGEYLELYCNGRQWIILATDIS